MAFTTVKIAPDLYTKPPKNAMPGARKEYRVVALATGDLVTSQGIALAVLPAGHRLHDLTLEVDKLDSNGSPAITINVGLLNSYYNSPLAATGTPGWDAGTSTALATGYNIFTSATVGQTGGRLVAPSPATLEFTSAIGVDYIHDRIIGVSFGVAPATAAAGNLGITFTIDMD